MTTPAAIITRQKSTVIGHNGGAISLHAGTVVTEPRVIELAMAQGVVFDLPQSLVIARGSGAVTIDGGETLALNAAELVLKLDNDVVRAFAADKRITSLRIGNLQLTLEAKPAKLARKEGSNP